MKPECYLSSKQEQNNQMPVNPNLSYSDKLNSLTAAFGSSKKRKAMQTKLKNKLDVETLETAVGNAIEESKKNAVLRPVVSLDKDLETESNFFFWIILRKQVAQICSLFSISLSKDLT